MAKRIVERPWGTRRNGGWVIRTDSLTEALKKGDAVQFEKVTVGTKNLIQLLRLMPGDHCKISANGRLEVETVAITYRKNGDGQRKASYGRPKHYWNQFILMDGAWLKPHMRVNPVILKPRIF